MKASDDGFNAAVVPSGASAKETGRNRMGAPVSEEGAPPCNTAPSNHGFQLYRSGIDSAYLSFQGSIDSDIELKLLDLKCSAASPDPLEKARAQFEILDHVFEVSDRGWKKFSYILRDDHFMIFISSSNARKIPLAYVQISAKCLNSMTLVEAYEELKGIVSVFGRIATNAEGSAIDANVSRVDIYVDFWTDFPVSKLKPINFVTRARDIVMRWEGVIRTGIHISPRGDLQFRIYDKTLEIKSSKKFYMRNLWRTAGWDGEKRIWRAEAQLRGPVLKQLRKQNPYAVQFDMPLIWGYVTHNWLRIVSAGKHQDRDRWPVSPFWQNIQSAFNNPHQLKRLKNDPRRVIRLGAIVNRSLNPLAMFMAKYGIADLERAQREFWTKTKNFMERYQPHINMEKMMQEKANIYRRTYNIRTAKIPDGDE